MKTWLFYFIISIFVFKIQKMTSAQIEIKDFLMNTFLPKYITDRFSNKNILYIKKKEIENFHFKYYIIDFEFIDEVQNDITVDIQSYLKGLYLKGFSFETLIQDICSKQNKYQLLYPFIRRISFIIRYSKKYNTLSCTQNFNRIEFIKKSNNSKRRSVNVDFKEWEVNKFILRKNTGKLFNINKNNKVLMYFSMNRMPKYISLKNASAYIRNNPDFKEVIQKLFNIHLNNEMIIPENSVFINNKYVNGKNDYVDIIKNINSNINIDMLYKFEYSDIINTLIMLKKEEADKFIDFYNKYYFTFEHSDFYKSLLEIHNSNQTNRFLYFLCFYVLYKKNIIDFDYKKMYYSNLYKPFIKDIIQYITDNFQKEIVVNLDFNSHNQFQYIYYKNYLKLQLKERSNYSKSYGVYANKFVSLFNESQKELKNKIAYIDNFSELYKTIINENIIIDLKKIQNSLWFKFLLKEEVVLISVFFDSARKKYSITNILASNNKGVDNFDFIKNISNLKLEEKIFTDSLNKKRLPKISNSINIMPHNIPEIELPF